MKNLETIAIILVYLFMTALYSAVIYAVAHFIIKYW